jgi:fatty-acyl-CoA synthase
VVLVPPKTLKFTSSGKLSRSAVKADYISGEIWDLNLAHAQQERSPAPTFSKRRGQNDDAPPAFSEQRS